MAGLLPVSVSSVAGANSISVSSYPGFTSSGCYMHAFRVAVRTFMHASVSSYPGTSMHAYRVAVGLHFAVAWVCYLFIILKSVVGRC